MNIIRKDHTPSAPLAVRDVPFAPGGCTGCGACVELAPDIVGWREEDESPYLLNDVAPDDVLNELMAFCPEGCFGETPES